MVSAQKRVRPGRCAAERFVLDDGRVVEHFLLDALVLHAVIRASPDAFEIKNFALAVARSAARAVALVLGALRFGTEERDVGKRAIAAVFAFEHRDFARMFEHAQ